MPPAVGGEPNENVDDDQAYDWLRQQLQHVATLNGVDNDSDVEEEWRDPTGGILAQTLAACELGDAEQLAELLAEAEFDIDTPGPDGDSALHIACLYGHFDCVKALLEKGSKPGLVNPEDGSTPLHDAAAGGYKDILELLIAKSPESVKVADNDGDTPLHNAARGNHLHIVEVLVKHGADPSVKNNDGNTPAQEADDPQVFEFLDTYGQDG